ncbi:MAG: prolyl oligopeptidase family serine peptidase [Pseudomonadota bacterium]
MSSLNTATDDPYIWLEDIEGRAALDWVEQQNARSVAVLEAENNYQIIFNDLLEIYNSKQRIAYPAQHGSYIYNFWDDEEHVRGIWRRTTLTEYRKDAPAWEIVLDLDQLAAEEDENWVWEGVDFLYPDDRRCLISLSRGGADASVIREFDVTDKAFVVNGFELPEAKSDVEWRDADTLYVATDFGPGSLTTSGYPRVIKEWKRGTPLASATVVYQGQASDVSVSPWVVRSADYRHEAVMRRISFYTSETFLRHDDALVKLDVPQDATPGFFQDQLLIELRSDWTVAQQTYPQGALLAIALNRFLDGKRDFTVLYQPADRCSLTDYSVTRQALVVTELNNVKGCLHEWSLNNGNWRRRSVAAPMTGDVNVISTDMDTDEYFITFTDFLTPDSLLLANTATEKLETLKSLPAFFDTTALAVHQYEATSADGTKIPYFVVAPKTLDLNGATPTLLYGYGGFEVAMLPDYDVSVGAGWLKHGGIYVLANIRGGGEFGPSWHQAAQKENKHKSYEDFIAVAEDLIARKITAPTHLGIMGGSNGGLLMGAVMIKRPDLFGAVVSEVPLFDMKRYHQLLAGASWMDEYGNPDDVDEWAYIQTYSPYQNVVREKNYPPLFVTTSTRDDRVHPGHARKMVAKMLEQGHEVLYFENTEGGHGGAANNEQEAKMSALTYTFLLKMLKMLK